jgi:choline-glycine betaine transporter
MPESPEAARLAMGVTFFHWGFHAWGLYGLMALALAYFAYNRGLPLTVRSTFYPLIGERIHGRAGDVIDVLAALATLFGLATSLGLGAQQVNAGFAHLFGIPQSTTVQVILIAVITALATISVVLGLDRGIKRLSQLNVIFAGLLLTFVLFAGPTRYLLDALVQNFGIYLRYLPKLTLWTAGSTAGRSSTGPGGSPGRPSSASSWPACRAGARYASSSAPSWWCRRWLRACGSPCSGTRRSTSSSSGRAAWSPPFKRTSPLPSFACSSTTR